MSIERQGATHNPGGVIGPPALRNQARTIDVRLEALPGGRIRVSSPQARGWAAVARTPMELARAVTAAFTEVQVAAYSAWHGEAYDLDELTLVDPASPLTAAATPVDMEPRRRSDIHSPAAWTPLSNGRWRSPAGREFRADTETVRRIRAKRRQMGIPEPGV